MEMKSMYSMALDNSWLVMNEDEMYDVNGGGTTEYVITFATDAVFKSLIGLSAFAAATSLLPTASSLLAPLNAIPVVGTALYLAALRAFVGAATYAISKGINIVLNVSFWSFRNKTHYLNYTL